MIALRFSTRHTVWKVVGIAAVVCSLHAAATPALASPACNAVNSGTFNFSSPAADAGASSLLTAWQTGDKVTLTFTDAIGATHTEGVYQGGNLTPLQTVSVSANSNGGFTYTIAGNDLLDGILLNPENNDTVTASCAVTSLLATNTGLTTSSNPINVGFAVQFAVTVSGNGGTPTGSVALYDNGAVLGTSPLSGGATTFAPLVLSEGFHNITATYLGDATFTSSMSPAMTQAVERLAVHRRR